VTNVVIIGGGPGGYEAALVASQLGADVTLIERDGIGGAAVLTDVVPSKALVAVAEAAIDAKGSSAIGVHAINVTIDIADVNARLKKWAANQSADIRERLLSQGVKVLVGIAELVDASSIKVNLADGTETFLTADVVLLATGARPRELPSAVIDGKRILNWKQLYEFTELPADLIVVGSGVTGAEFASHFSFIAGPSIAWRGLRCSQSRPRCFRKTWHESSIAESRSSSNANRVWCFGRTFFWRSNHWITLFDGGWFATKH
jgi:dihydrolipoamide dehydrogenase